MQHILSSVIQRSKVSHLNQGVIKPLSYLYSILVKKRSDSMDSQQFMVVVVVVKLDSEEGAAAEPGYTSFMRWEYLALTV